MSRCTALALFVLLATVSLARAQEPFKPEIIERGKKATALVQVGVLWEGSAFCIDKSGLFVTTSHVLEKALESTVEIRLLLDNGLKSERSLRAKLVRRDDRLDLALLQVDPTLKAEDFRDLGRFTKALAQLKQDADLTALELGKDADLAELAPIATLGCSSRPLPPGGRVRPLPVVVVMNHITALRRDHGELVAIQVDSQLDAGFSGGPVLDRSGRAIGVVAAAQRKTAMNRAIPAGRLAEFLAAPKIVFDPPPLTDIDRHRQVNWTIKVEPTTRDGLPKGTSVAVTLEDEPTKRRSFAAEAGNAGTFQVLLSPISPEMQGVQLAARFRTGNPTVTIRTRDRETTIPGDPTITLQMRDQEVTVCGKKVRLR